MKRKTKQIDYLHQERSHYNRQSGKKTLALVSILLLFVLILSVATLLII